MAKIRKNSSIVRRADSNETSAAIETHLIHLGAAEALYPQLSDCGHSRCGSSAVCCLEGEQAQAGSTRAHRSFREHS